MAEDAGRRGSNSAQIRGDIQAGLTGDKRPGFDPAMAPLETDSEAGGVPLSRQQIETARHEQREGRPIDISGDSGTAMRPSFAGNRPQQGPFWLYFFGIALIATIGIGVLVAVYALPSPAGKLLVHHALPGLVPRHETRPNSETRCGPLRDREGKA